jgi:two-component system chemotaxis response regulator CheY
MILLTARDNISDIVTGLNSGADDYLTKPFDPLELQARIMVGERILTLEDTLRQTRDQLEHQALHDNLTGLMNRRAIYKYIQIELEKACRTSTPFSLIFMDIDDFKTVNDRFGHMTGDVLLKNFADVLRSQCRPYDGLGRWAGDEFIVALPNANSENAAKVANRISSHAHTRQMIPSAGTDFQFSVSAGIATINSVPEVENLLEQLIQSADEALYRAKNAGKGRVETNQLDLLPHV